MINSAVHWQEGMFLRPHHFQTADRHRQTQAVRTLKWDHHYCWGIRLLEIDEDAMRNYRLVVRRLFARFRDGSVVSVPEDGELPALDLRTAFHQGNLFEVFLAIPLFSLGKSNSSIAPEEQVRWTIDTCYLEDENTGINSQPIPCRKLNLRLMLSSQDTSGYEVLPIARLEKSARAEAVPQFDPAYIPPLLACEAWPPLQRDVLGAIADRMGKKIDYLADQIATRGITFDSQTQGEPLLIHQLRELNEAYCTLHAMLSASGVSPLTAYTELCRMVGMLAIFGAARRAPELPRYDHDDLARCFFQARQELDAYLNLLVEPEYKERSFIGAGYRMQVALEPSWLEGSNQMFVAVKSPLEEKECLALVGRQGALDMKVSSSARVDEIFRLGSAGLKFEHCPRPPRAVPMLPGQVYLQITRDSKDTEWQSVQQTLSLALRVNENLLAGSLHGERLLTVKKGGKNIPLQFSLYVVPEGK